MAERVKRTLRILWCWLRGRHGVELDGWGYGMAGMVDLYCDGCGAKFGTIPLEDFEGMPAVFEAIGRHP